MNTSPVAPFETPATRAAGHPQAQQSAAQMPPADGPATGSDAVFAAPALFLSPTSGTAAAESLADAHLDARFWRRAVGRSRGASGAC